MGILVWLIVGGVCGWLASIIMRTDAQQGILLNIVVGIVGALLAGFIVSPLIGIGTINQGISLYIVQGLLGHQHPRTTQRYAHLAQKTLLDAAELIATVVGGPNGEAKTAAAGREQTQAKTDGFGRT